MNRFEHWSSSFNDENVKLGHLYPGEIRYRKEICRESLLRYQKYCKNTNNISNSKLKKDSKFVILINGELRFLDNFLPWVKKISNISNIYIYTDKSSYENCDKELIKKLESSVEDIRFSEEDKEYLEENKKSIPTGGHQWLKLKMASKYWGEKWKKSNSKYILRMRSDIAFYNPYLLEYFIYQGIESLNINTIISRSDVIFAYHIDLLNLIANFYDELSNIYLKKEWYEYPFLPIDPKIIINTMGGTRIEWCHFPVSYVGNSPSRKNFIENFIKNYEIIDTDYNKFLKNKEFTFLNRKEIFGKLSTVRYQPNNIFESERTFAHYLAKNGITALNHNNLFSGKIIRKYSLVAKLKLILKNSYFE